MFDGMNVTVSLHQKYCFVTLNMLFCCVRYIILKRDKYGFYAEMIGFSIVNAVFSLHIQAACRYNLLACRMLRLHTVFAVLCGLWF